jgi:hydrogenase maturation factor
MDIQKVKHIRTVSTNSGADFQDRVNELLRTGDYVLLHFGFEIEHDNSGKVVTPTIAVLGSEKPEPPKPQVVIERG